MRGDDLQGQRVVAHGAVAHGVGAAGARGAHAAQRGIGARVYGKEQARVAHVFVELLARDARLHRDGEVFSVHSQDVVHARDIQADAALHGQQMPFH